MGGGKWKGQPIGCPFHSQGEIVIFYFVKDNYFSPPCQGCRSLLFTYVCTGTGGCVAPVARAKENGQREAVRGRGEILIFYYVKDKYFSRSWQGVFYVNFH